jgi:UDP-glucose 4-epimerase
MKTVLVTGSHGFVGTQLVTQLLNGGQYRVIAVDDSIILGYSEYNNLIICNTSYDNIANFQNVDAVVHLANYKYNDNSNRLAFDIAALPKFLNKFQPHVKFVYASSAAVYDENYDVNPSTMYGLSKLTQENILLESDFNNLSILRFFNIYGKSSNGGVIQNFKNAIVNNEPIYINGDGNSTRDYIHVSDIVNSIIKEIECESTGKIIKNIGTGIGTSLNNLASMMFDVFGKSTTVIHNQSADCGIQFSIAPNHLYNCLDLKTGLREFQIDNSRNGGKILA